MKDKMKKVGKNIPAGVYEKEKKPEPKKKKTRKDDSSATSDNQSDRKDSQDFNQI
jgi:hypothetical protein